MREGNYHGYGFSRYEDGTIYRGLWVNGVRHGYGKEENAALDYKYTGNFAQNQKHGFGCQ